MPLFVVNDDRPLFALFVQFLYDTVCLLRHRLVQVFAHVVVAVDLFRHFMRRLIVFFHEQRHGLFSVLYAPRGIDTRSDFEDDVTDGQLPLRQAAYVDDGLEPDARVGIQLS